ncbi:MAG: hypothetical protein PHE89_07785 [Alphaproteobacteria bacterium]|nr:hypothetical protein [Alphaproteobacteria bacterium]
MNYKAVDHFSNDFEFDISKTPARKTDRAAFFLLLPGLFFAFLLIAIGFYELLNGFNSQKTVFDEIERDFEYTASLINPAFFDFVIITIGFWIVWSLAASYIRYKKISFDGESFTLTHRPVFGEKRILKNLKIADYEGVRFRVEFYQYGLFNRNKYIIELFHKEEDKTIPLYIGTRRKNFTSLISHYAKFFNKPIIYVTTDGPLYKEVDVFTQPLLNQKDLLDLSKNETDDPKFVQVKQGRDKLIIKVRKALFDAYNILAVGALLVSAFILFFLSGIRAENDFVVFLIQAGASLGLFFSFLFLFRKDKIVIKKDKVIVVHKFWLFSRKHDEMQKSDIVWVDVAYNPALNRNFLVVYSLKDSMVFGKKLPINDLKWVRNLLIREILK